MNADEIARLPTPLTDALGYEKREVEFVHTSPGWEGVKDSHYEMVEREVPVEEALEHARRLEQARAALMEALEGTIFILTAYANTRASIEQVKYAEETLAAVREREAKHG